MLVITALLLLTLWLPAVVTVVSGSANCSTWYERAEHSTTGVWRSVQDPRFGAKGDGATDDTKAFEAALDFRRDDAALKLSPGQQWGEQGPEKAPAVVYVPPGRYVISDTLVLFFYTHLVGNYKCPPTLVLKPSSPGFTNRSAGMKPFLAAMIGYNTSTAAHNWWGGGSENMNFYTEIQHLRVEIGAGNTAATGILWGVAQQTSIRRVVVDAGPAAIGIDVSGQSGYAAYKGKSHSIGGGGTIEDVVVNGADVGMKVASSQWAMRGITLRGAASVGLSCGGNWAVQFVDLEVADCPVAVRLEGGFSYVILDSRMSNISGGTAIVITGGNLPLFVENATADSTVKFLVGTTVPGPSLSSAYWQGDAFINGTKQQGHGAVAASRMKRESRPRPTFEPTDGARDPANVLSFGAKGDGMHDDTAAFRSAIAASETVFVPWGLFRITDTLLLRSHTKIIGEGLAHIWLGNSSAGFDDPNTPKPLILTPSDSAAEVWLADLRLTVGSGNSGAVTVHWLAGSASGIWDVHIPWFAEAQSKLFHLDGEGGGVFSNIWLWGADHDVQTNKGLPQPNQFGFLATSSGAAWFYGVACEHDTVWAWMLRNASNIVMVGTPQTEATALALGIVDSDRIEVFGTLNTRYGAPTSLISVNRTRRLRIVCPNVLRSAMLIDSASSAERVPSNPKGWSTATIAWES